MKSLQFARFASGIALAVSALLVAPAHAGPYSNLFVFGDSVSDSGNVATYLGVPGGVPQTVGSNSYIPAEPYAPSGTFSNGPVWVTDFANMLGLSAAPSLTGGTGFAFGGARTDAPEGSVPPSLKAQAGMFLQQTLGVAPAGALYVVAGVGNDARDVLQAILTGADSAVVIPAAAAAYAGNVVGIVDELRAAGAQKFLVLNTFNLGLTPAVASFGAAAADIASFASAAMDSALAARLDSQAGVQLFDSFSFLTGIAQDPGFFGLVNATDACGAVAGVDCSRYLFWDGIHPTAAAHGILANAVFAAVVPEPETYALFALGLVAVVLAKGRRKAGA